MTLYLFACLSIAVGEKDCVAYLSPYLHVLLVALDRLVFNSKQTGLKKMFITGTFVFIVMAVCIAFASLLMVVAEYLYDMYKHYRYGRSDSKKSM